MEGIIEFITVAWPFILAVVVGLHALVAGIAPLTKTDKDDKLAKFLKRAHDLLIKVTFFRKK